MKRGFLFISIALCVGWIAGAQALGVGEIEVNSHLNQRLSAEIPLVETGELGPEEMLVSLGAPEDFERAGVERFFYLTDMRFEVFSDGRGPRIRVTSRQPVTEPYLNFIVEVLWPKGRMLKEFTILLDPPTYQAGVAPPTTVEPAPATVTRPSPRTPAEDAAETAYVPESTRGTGSGRASPPEVPGDGVLTTGQTLWRIAERYRPANDIELNQYMVAIQQTNPQAFINRNINLMKAGYRLKMPDADAARQTSAAEADAQVAEQMASWRNEEQKPAADTEAAPVEEVAAAEDSGSASGEAADPDASLAAQIDATPTGAGPGSAEEAAPAGSVGRLEIQADADSFGAAESPAANVSEAGLREEKDRLEREIQELGYQSDRDKELASQQIAERDRKLEVKDQQLADLTAKLEAANRKLAERDGQSSPDQSQSATPWWQSTAMMIVAGLILVLVLVAALLLARRRQQAAQDAAFMETVVETQAKDGRVDPSVARTVALAPAPAGALAVAAGAAAPASVPASDGDTFDFLDDLTQDDDEHLRSSPPESETGAGESPARQTGDVIGEADIYAAYGRYPHAIGLLLGALEEDPDRHDVRLKLLEVAVTANDSETFDKHIRELVSRCDDQDILLAARELEEGFVGASEDHDDFLSDKADESTPLVDDGEELAMDDLLADSEPGKVAEEFSLEIEETEGDAPFSLPRESTSARPTPSGVAATGAHDEYLHRPAGERSALPVEGVSNPDDDYTVIASDDVPTSRTDVLGGDLGIEFDADEPAVTAALAEDDRNREEKAPLDDLADDLDLDDLLAELEDSSVAPGVPAESVTDRPSTPEDFEFKRLDDVPLLETTEALSDDVNLDDEQGLEDLDDLLASLDEVEEGSAADPTSAPRSAEILSFTRPKADAGVRSNNKAFEDDLESDAADDDEEFDFGDSEDAAETKLDLAQAYIEMGDAEGAQDILNEVLSEGNQAQQELARSLLDSLAS